MKKILLITIVVLSLFSCEKMIFDKDSSSVNPKENFEYLWNQIDTKYSYLNLVRQPGGDKVDWNKVKSDYSAKIYEGMTDDSLFNVLGAMMNELQDDHTNLISNFNISVYGRNKLGQDNFDWRIVEDNYLPRNYNRSGPFRHDTLKGGEIGYIRFPAFTGGVDEINMDYILNKYKNSKGLVLDLRENGGGAVADVFSLLSRFVEKDVTVYYTRLKNGPGHDDFTDAEPAVLKPNDGVSYTKKIVMLVDRGTFSAGSFTSLATKAIPNIVLMGDTTGGGLGLPNGGQLPNGWTYRFSITQALTLDTKSPDYENGVPPDVAVSIDWTDLKTDEIIEAAIVEINNISLY